MLGMDSSSASQPARRNAEYAIYKPNGRGTGGVVRFELNREKEAVFVDAASQSGEKSFDWENKLTMKWGLSDLGSVLATLQGREARTKLFHKTAKANSALEFVRGEDPQQAPYFMRISRKDEASGEVRKVAIPITHSEAAVLETALRSAVVRLLGW